MFHCISYHGVNNIVFYNDYNFINKFQEFPSEILHRQRIFLYITQNELQEFLAYKIG